MADTTQAAFVEPMLLLASPSLPAGADWIYELKLDGYRAIGIKTRKGVQLRSRNNNDLSSNFPEIAGALSELPEETVVDGEVVALDSAGRPSFNALQNYRSGTTAIFYFVFDLLVFSGRDIMSKVLSVRRELLRSSILPRMQLPIREVPELDGALSDVIAAVKAQGLEGVVAKNQKSRYEPGCRSGAWQKMRINKEQEFVIGGYTRGSRTFDALIFGYYDGERLLYAGRTRNGFTPVLREQIIRLLRGREIGECPFANLPESKAGRWGLGLTIEKMKECRWVRPDLVAQFEFVEWTPDHHLRHSGFVRLRNDKNARDIRRES
jgi:bifunctional non-homologous end joining protein LigD